MTGTWSQPGFEALVRMISERTGLGLQDRSNDDMERATRRAMQRAGITGPTEFARSLASGANWDDLIEEITIRETYFYRTPEHFELVRKYVLPALRKLRGEQHGVRAWSAGCASGEEAYSLAMMLHQEQLLASAQVHGSDLCERALERARAGRYRDWSLRGLDPNLARMYLREDGNEKVVREALRTKVSFSQVNLATLESPSPPGTLDQMDLIFCRNVLIYFDAETIARVARGLYEALAPGGWLVIGPSDPVLGAHAPFEIVTTDHGLLYRKPERPGAVASASVTEQALLGAQPRVRSARAPLPIERPISGPTIAARPPQARAVAEESKAPAAAEASAAVLQTEALEPEELAAEEVRDTFRRAGSAAALAACEHALSRHVLHAQLHYLRALALMDLGCHDDAVQTLRRCLYLDRSLIMAHFTLGTLLRRIGDDKGARTALRNVLEGAGAHAREAVVPLSEGLNVGTLCDAAARSLLELEERS